MTSSGAARLASQRICCLVFLLLAGCTQADDAQPVADGGGGNSNFPDAGGLGNVGGVAGVAGTKGDLAALDIIFVIDNSGSMKEEIQNLKSNMPAFISELAQFSGGLPDLRVAVMTGNLGLGGGDVPGCAGDGFLRAILSNWAIPAMV